MFFIKLNNISKSFIDEKPLVNNLDLTISKGTILGIIGKNGEGKTTLFNIIAGNIKPDEGSVIFSSNKIKLAYHTQFIPLKLKENLTIEEYILTSFPKLNEINKEIEELSKNAKEQSEIQRLIELQSEFEELQGYKILSEIDEALIKLNLTNFNSKTLVNNLSGGQKTRLQLASILIQDKDILLLDEPTNHLDREAINWLENYIRLRKGITIIISHDRSFLNNTAKQILELERGKWKLYFGNYDDYKSDKEKIIQSNEIVIKQKNREINKLREATNVQKSQAFQDANKLVDKRKYGKFAGGLLNKKSGKKARRAKMFEKRLDQKAELIESLKPTKYQNIGFRLSTQKSEGDFALRINNFDLKIKDKVLAKDVSLEIMQGDKVSILGENGSGKTTLIKSIIEAYQSSDKNIKFGGNIKLGYFSQEHDELDLGLTVLEEFRKNLTMTQTDAANYLHKMLFTHQQLSQKVRDLSQGEKSKLALAKLLVEDFNFLILDEPTNHLDIPSREVLETALKDYLGTLLVVSHDRYFLDTLEIRKEYFLKSEKKD